MSDFPKMVRAELRETPLPSTLAVTTGFPFLEGIFILFLYSGRFKAWPELGFIPIDITPVLFVITMCGLTLATFTGRMQRVYIAPPLIVMVIFYVYASSSILWSSFEELNMDKLLRCAAFTFPSFFIGYILTQQHRVERLTKCIA